MMVSAKCSALQSSNAAAAAVPAVFSNSSLSQSFYRKKNIYLSLVVLDAEGDRRHRQQTQHDPQHRLRHPGRRRTGHLVLLNALLNQGALAGRL